MKNQRTDSEPAYRPIIEANFETSGPYIGRMKNTIMARDVANAERRIYDNPDAVRHSISHQDHAENITRSLIKGRDEEVSRLESEANSVRTDEVVRTEEAVVDDYERLKAAKESHDNALMEQARNREVDMRQPEDPSVN